MHNKLCKPKIHMLKKLTLDNNEFYGYYNLVRVRNATVAQSVEQLIRNQQVAGSIPAIGSIKE